MPGAQPCRGLSVPPLSLEPAGELLHWYAIHTVARHEKKVTTRVQEKGVVTFLPVIAQRHRWSDRYKTIELALFPSYTFVRIRMSAEKRLDILQTPGVLEFVGVHGAGTPIPDREIEDIQTVLAQNVGYGLFPFLTAGRRVRIRGGCLDGVEGILLTKNVDRSLIVSIELIQRSIAVRVDGYEVESL